MFAYHNSGLNIDTLRHVKNGSMRWAWNLLYRGCESLVFRRLNGTIASGLFEGIQFPYTDIVNTPMPKILGTYEKEIQEVFGQWDHKKFNRFINVGGAEGFYAVGITKIFEVENAIVFEMLEKGRSMIRRISERNRVSPCVTIHSKCEEQNLYDLCDKRANDLIFIDVEGAEIELLSARVLEKLRNSTVVVEAHDFQVDNCTNRVRKMFSSTHDTKVISSRTRIEKDFPLSYPFPNTIKFAMMDERRPEVMNWIIANPEK